MERKGKKFAIVCFLMLVFLMKSTRALSEEISLEAEGTAQIVGGNQVTAREKAIRDFEIRAVVKAVLELLGPDQYQRNRDKIQKAVITRGDRYVKAYRISGEEPQQETYRVKGEAIILMDALKKDLRALGLEVKDIKAVAASGQDKKTEEKKEQSSEGATSVMARNEETKQSPHSERSEATTTHFPGARDDGSGRSTKEPSQPSGRDQVGREKLPVLFWSFDRSCDQELEGKNAGDVFSEIFVTRIAESGFNVVSSEQEPPGNSDAVRVHGDFICVSSKVSIRLEILQNSQKQEIEDFVPVDTEETPLMDALTTLAEMAANHLVQTLGYTSMTEESPQSGVEESRAEGGEREETVQQPESGESQPSEDKGSQSPQKEAEKRSASDLWQIVIKDPHGGMMWEKLQRSIKEAGGSIEVSRILISPESFTVETPELSGETIKQIEVTSRDKLNLKVESIDDQARRIVIVPQSR
ncbi:MAG: hypothetical protein ACP5TY_06450 [Thermodesulforhabdaceae bacterium]